MFHNTVYKFSKVDNLGCGLVAIKEILFGRSDRNKRIFLARMPLGPVNE